MKVLEKRDLFQTYEIIKKKITTNKYDPVLFTKNTGTKTTVLSSFSKNNNNNNIKPINIK